MKTHHFALAVAAVALLIGVSLYLAAPPVATAIARCPAPVQTSINEIAQKEQGSFRNVEIQRTNDVEFYDAIIAAPDGKVWSVKLLADGTVLELDQRKEAKGRLIAVRDALQRWF